MWQTFKLKLFNNKKLFYIAVLAIIAIVVLVYAVISFNNNKDSVYTGELLVSSPQVYIDDFDKLEPGVNDPNAPDTIREDQSSPQIDILTTNGTKQTDVNLQYVATIYAKTIDTLPSEKIEAGEYLNASLFYISDIDGKEIEDKYYVLDNKTTVLAKNYAETDGEVIAVRYYLPSEPLPAAPSETAPTFLVNSYLLGLDSYAPTYYVNNAETCVTIKTQVSAYEPALAEWSLADSKVIFSTGYSGTPIDTSNLFLIDPNSSSAADSEVPNQVENEVTAVSETTVPVDETAPEETAVPAETTAPTETSVPESVETEGVTTTRPTETSKAEETTTATAPPETIAETTTTTADTRVFPESMSINTGSVNLNIGDTYTFSVSFEPSNTTEAGVTWTSDNPSVASVSSGTVTAHAAGKAAITVQSVNGMALTVYVNVSAPAETAPPVTEPAVEATPEPVNVILNASSLSLAVGDSYQLSADIYPLDIQFPAAVWSSSNDAIVQVSASGLIYANSSGTAIVTATASNGITAQCSITVQ